MATFRIGTAVIDFEGRDSGFRAAISRASKQSDVFRRRQRALRNELRKTNRAITAQAKSLLSIRSVVGLLAGGGGFGLLIKSAARTGSEIENLSQALGLTRERIQLLQRAGGDYNIETEQLNKGLLRFTRSVGEAGLGIATYLRVFEQLGIQIRDSGGQLRPVAVLLEEFGAAIARVGNEAERTQLLQTVLGREGARLGLLLGRSAQDMDEFLGGIQQLGILSDDQIISLNKLNQEFNNLGDEINEQKLLLGGLVSKEMSELLVMIRDNLPAAFGALTFVLRNGFIPALDALLNKTAPVVAGITSLLLAKNKLVRAIGAAVPGIIRATGLLTALGGAAIVLAGALAVPLAAWLATAVAIGVVIQAFVDFRRLVNNVIETIKTAFTLIFRLVQTVSQAIVTVFAAIIDLPARLFGVTGVFAGELENMQTALDNVGSSFTRLLKDIAVTATGFDTLGESGVKAIESISDAAQESLTPLTAYVGSGRVSATAAASGAGDAEAFRQEIRRIRQRRQFTDRTRLQRQQDTLAQSVRRQRNRRQFTDLANTDPNIAKRAIEEQERLRQAFERNQQVARDVGRSFGNFFESIVKGTATASDAFKNLAASIAEAVFQTLIVDRIASSITGAVSGFFGGGGGAPPANAAQGGIASAGRAYMVGESGPERFVPQVNGRIIPNRSLGGSVSVVQNFNIESTDGPGVRAALQEAAPIFRRQAFADAVDGANRPGGLAGQSA